MKRKIYTLFTLLLTFIFATCIFASCNKDGTAKAKIKESTENMIIIEVTKVNGEVALLSVMESLKENGEIEFAISNGMITEVNGIKNKADFSYCWMLYTSDTELSNTEWGTVLYNEQTYGSAIVGAEELLVIDGAYYILSYESLS